MTTPSTQKSITANQETGRATGLNPITVPAPNLSPVTFAIIGILLAIGAAFAVNLTSGLSPVLLLGGAAAIFLVIAVFQKPELGAYILIISVFTNLSDLFTEKGLPSINRPMVALVVLSIFVNYILKTGKLSTLPKPTRIDMVLLAYLFAVTASALIAINQTESFTYIFDLIKDIAVGYCIYYTLDTKEKVKTGIVVLLAAITFISVLGTVHTVSGTSSTFWGFAQDSVFNQSSESDGELRYAGPIGESNIWGQVLVSALPIALYMFTKARTSLSRMKPLIAGLFILLAMLFTESRGAILALTLIMIFIAIDLRINGSTLFLIAGGMLLLLFILPAKYTERIKSLDILFQNQEYGYTEDSAIDGRRAKMLIGLSMFAKNPFLGVGFHNYGDNFLIYAEDLGLTSSALKIDSGSESETQPHSLYVELMAETGLFGITTFLTFLGLIFHGLYKIRMRTKKSTNAAERDWSLTTSSIMMSLITYLIAGLFLHGIGFRFIWVLIGLALAFLYIDKKQPAYGTTA